MELIQDRLDVKKKTRANLFNWRGQFTPEFVDYILQNFAHNSDTVVDPFAGIGTVLLESANSNLSCYGYEINPAAYLMSKFFTFCNVLPQDRVGIASSVKNRFIHLIAKYDGLPMFTPSDSFRQSFGNLLDLSRELFPQIEDPAEKILAINTLFTAEDYKNGTIETSVFKAFNYVNDCLMRLPYTDKSIDAYLGDARLLHNISPIKFNLIFTSPPYINVFNYHQNHRAMVETLGWNILEIARSEIGSNRKNRGNRFKTVVQYCLDMELTLKSFWECLEKDGFVVIVIGRQSNVRRVPFSNVGIVKDIAERIGCFKDIQNFTRTFINKFGLDIKEDIVVFQKSAKSPTASIAREVSSIQFELSLQNVPEEAKEGILDAIASIDAILPSPFLSVGKGVL